MGLARGARENPTVQQSSNCDGPRRCLALFAFRIWGLLGFRVLSPSPYKTLRRLAQKFCFKHETRKQSKTQIRKVRY